MLLLICLSVSFVRWRLWETRMRSKVFGFSSDNLDHVAFSVARGLGAVSDTQQKVRATKCRRYMSVGDFICLLTTESSGKQGLLAVGQVDSLPEIVQQPDGSYLGTYAKNTLWGEGPWYMPFGVKFLHPLRLERMVPMHLLREMNIKWTDFGANGTMLFSPSRITGDQFLDLWNMLMNGPDRGTMEMNENPLEDI